MVTGSAIAKRSHLIASAVEYVGQPFTELLLSSPKPELTWIYSASIATVIELLVVTGFGSNRTPTLSVTDVSVPDGLPNKDKEIGSLVILIMTRAFDMSYMLRNVFPSVTSLFSY
jgi:hypothetical protein